MNRKAKDIFMYSLGAFVMFLIFSCIAVVLLRVIPPENKELAFLIIGNLMAWGGMILGFFYSSTKGSQEKTDLLAKAEPIKDPDK